MQRRYIHVYHHGFVWVREDLQGHHREFCLCYACKRYDPKRHQFDCEKARRVYEFCQEENLGLVVWECPEFRPR